MIKSCSVDLRDLVIGTVLAGKTCRLAIILLDAKKGSLPITA
jgi:hypothetical protein